MRTGVRTTGAAARTGAAIISARIIIATNAMRLCNGASTFFRGAAENHLSLTPKCRYIRSDTTNASYFSGSLGASMQRAFRLALLATASRLVQTGAYAQGAPSNAFNLGQIEQVTITGSPFARSISESVVTNEETFKFNALTVDRAIDLAAGVASGTTGGPRNEKLYFVR